MIVGQVDKALIEAMVVNKTSMLKKTINDMSSTKNGGSAHHYKLQPRPLTSKPPTKSIKITSVETPTANAKGKKNILIDLSSPKHLTSSQSATSTH